LVSGIGDAVESCFEVSAFAGGEVDGCAEREGDDVGVIVDCVFDALNDPAKEAAGVPGGTACGYGGGVARHGGGHALKDFDVEEGGGGGYTNEFAGSGASGCGGEGCSPSAMALLVLWGAVVAGTGKVGLIDFAEVEGEVGSDVRVGGVDATVDDGDADSFAHGGIPWAAGGAAGSIAAVSSHLPDSPALWRVIEGVVGQGCVDDDAEGRVLDGLCTEVGSGDDAVVEDVFDVGLSAEATYGFVVGL